MVVIPVDNLQAEDKALSASRATSVSKLKTPDTAAADAVSKDTESAAKYVSPKSKSPG